ncbi:hypothetical protein [Arthrobacter sp. S39]|uniref:hypothetical protein n=1 Tax=Arthrobacter sp. S39 TaxID=2509720 RepID=UPI0010381582|nr:hypothetical protein [Arthrobacter sp. S39]TAP45624.1 hypothetical protein EYS21_02595 [Arthrobacter sp. S39]
MKQIQKILDADRMAVAMFRAAKLGDGAALAALEQQVQPEDADALAAAQYRLLAHTVDASRRLEARGQYDAMAGLGAILDAYQAAIEKTENQLRSWRGEAA